MGIVSPNENDNFEIEFLEKGKVKHLEDGKTEKKYRTIIDNFDPISGPDQLVGGYFFSIHLDNDSEKTMIGSINQDTLILNNYEFPIESYFQGDVDYSFRHFFVKQ